MSFQVVVPLRPLMLFVALSKLRSFRREVVLGVPQIKIDFLFQALLGSLTCSPCFQIGQNAVAADG